MRLLPLLLVSPIALTALSAATSAPLHDFSDPAVWQPNNDGGHAPEVAADPERKEHGAAMCVRYHHQAPHWGNLTGPCTVPAEARTLLLWVSKHSCAQQACKQRGLPQSDGRNRSHEGSVPTFILDWLR